ncbi:cyclin-dependent kinase 12-like isoform X3 [Seriola aureovittata]|uniref:cyclin-dependent kinase 12-like isoform X3 n=1 Tax=Seriola aureovittata TaxID=2871759 RepID=UPI0024BEE2E6|nr:cyclin-dependent kinase 12-like isoform X3 [Seriola aureovittata]XP_056229046.1 cyclin-dependent kinase 12-like isoform X3 [Seriola aureovittata]XP_056229047.1 cyclin-dependent kinase 12-like isoform X3 [Seriola aureovittata]
MMHSNRSEHSHRRQYSDRSSRQWGDYDDRREERHEPHRDVQWDSYHKYGGDGHSSTERTNRSREYSDSPKRRYSKDSVSRDWSRKSPVRRHVSSPDWSGAEKKRQRFTDDDEDDYRYRREPEDKTYRQSPDSFSHLHVPKDFKHTLPQEEDFKFSKTSQDSRHRHRPEEFTYRQQHDDYRLMSGYYKDSHRHERSWDRSEERTRSQERTSKSCGKPRERDDSPSTDHEDHRQNRTRFPLTESSGQSFGSDVTNQSPSVPEQKSTRGFQRFLDVLNKGVNVAMLTKIVTQTSPEICDQPSSPGSFMNTANRRWSPSSADQQQGSHQNNQHWNESEGSQSLASPQPHHRSFSPQGYSPSDEKSLQRSDGGQNYYSLNSRSRSPSVVGKITLTPEDEHKHRQMQDVLQAIGMDLGSEELGQMTHRIQERLYGKKDSDRGRHRRGSRERDSRQAFSPRRRSRSSSSSRSNFSSLTRDNYMRKDSCSARRDETEVDQVKVHQAEYGQNGSSSSLQDSEKCETNSQESSAALQIFSQNTTYSLSEPPLTPVMPTYSPVNCSPLPYPTLPPALPPNLPHVGPRLFLPRLPPFLPYPHIPPLNIIPAVLAQTRHLLPQNISNPQSPFFNLPNLNPVQPLNTTQKSKTQSRPRCLQVIETKQPG